MLSYRQNEPKKQILLINGSPRKKGNSDTLLTQIKEAIDEEEVSNETIYLRDYNFSSCIGCERCRKDKTCTGLKDDFTEIYEKIIDAQGLVFISPAHNYNVTALMKAFIDRLYCFYNFGDDRPRSWSSQLADQNRKSVVIGIAEQANPEDMGFTVEGMKRPANALGYEVIDTLEVYKVFERGKVKEDKEALEKAKNLGIQLSKAL